MRKVFPVAARRRTVKEAPRSIVEYSFFQLLRDRLFPFLARFDAPLRKHVFAIFRKLIDDEAVPEHLQQELLETRVLLREDVVIFLFSKNLTTHLVEFQSYLLEALVPNDENIANVEYSVEVAWITIPMDRSLELFQEDAWNDPFKILGIGRNFSEAEAKKIHRRLMMQHHPDREGEGADENYATELNKAWEAVCKVKGWRTKGT